MQTAPLRQFDPLREAPLLVPLPTRQVLIDTILGELRAGQRVVAVEGMRGVGKTTLSHMLEAALVSRQALVVRVRDTSALGREVAAALDLPLNGPHDMSSIHAALQENGRNLFLLLDDAERIPAAIWCWLQQLRLSGPVHLVLIGGGGAWAGLQAAGLVELRRAGAARHLIPPLTGDEARRFLQVCLQHRLRFATPSLAAAAQLSAQRELRRLGPALPAALVALSERVLDRVLMPGRKPSRPGITWIAVAAVPTVLLGLVGRTLLEQAPVVVPAAHRAAPPPQARHVLLPPPVRTAVLVPATPPPASALQPAPPAVLPGREPLPSRLPAPEVAAAGAVMMAPPVPPPADASSVAPATIVAAAAPETLPAPEIAQVMRGRVAQGGLGLALLAGVGDTMPSLYAKVYRGVAPPPYPEVVAVNRLPVKPGDIIVFPAPPAGWAVH